MTDSRREFLKKVSALVAAAAGTTAAGGLAGGCASAGLPAYRYTPSGEEINLFLSWYPELYKTGGAMELLLEGSDRRIVVVRMAIDRFSAVSPICTHQGCRVDFRENAFRCPCHGSRYGLDGSLVSGPAEKPLVSYRTEYRETSLRIFLS